MLKTAARVLRLLSLLQARREWSGAELGARLEVNARTIRRDVDRLRELGYVIDSSAGPGGGYRLGAGSATPPLLLDDDEAIAVAVSLTAAAGSVSDLQDIALRVLMKLDQLMPARLRRRLSALRDVTLSLPGSQVAVGHKTLTTIAAACRDHRRLFFKYRDQQNQTTAREVEPMRLVHTGRVWYLAAWDSVRADWRTFRVDRIENKAIKSGAEFVPREPPEDFVKQVSRAIASSAYQRRARLSLAGPIRDYEKKIPSWIGTLEPDGDDRCLLTVGADTDQALTTMIIHTGVDFVLRDPPELAPAIRKIAERLIRGTAIAKRAPRLRPRSQTPADI
jgi:predicted DNA-binding transcriptional regulator YafY